MVQTIHERVEEVHYTALHTALEQYLGRDIPGSLVYAHYPENELDQGNVKLVFAEASEKEDNHDG